MIVPGPRHAPAQDCYSSGKVKSGFTFPPQLAIFGVVAADGSRLPTEPEGTVGSRSRYEADQPPFSLRWMNS